MNYIKGFDGLRCYSILLVVVTHLGIAHQFEEGSYLRDHLHQKHQLFYHNLVIFSIS